MLKNLSVKSDNFSLFHYIACLVGLFFLSFTGAQEEPYGLTLLFACLCADMNPAILCLTYAVCSLIGFSLSRILTAVLSGGFLFLIYLIYRRNGRTPGWERYLYLAVSLAFWVVFGNTESYAVLAFLPTMAQRSVFAAFLLLLSHLFSYALRALLQKSFRCRLQTEELISLAVCFLIVGMGVYRLFGAVVTTSFFLFCLFLCRFALKSPSVFPVALLLGLPEAILTHSMEGCAILLLCASADYLFARSNRVAECLGVFVAFTLAKLFTGLFSDSVMHGMLILLSGFLPCLCYLLIPDFLLERLERKLVFYRERKLSRIAINHNRAVTGEKLFEISGIFREIEVAFDCLNQSGSEEKARLSIKNDLVFAVCSSCRDKKRCRLAEGTAFDRLISIACAKGKANFIDLPAELSSACINPGGMLSTLNKHVADYRNFLAETENVNAGRALLAEQAKGMSEILKSMAMEQSEPYALLVDKERELSLSLARAGILCTELLVYGEERNPTVNLITFGNVDGKQVASVLEKSFSVPFLPTEKMPLGDDKYCMTFKRRPAFNAAFGVSSLSKEGEAVCGDTYSLIRVDEKTFLVALSDGMGSGDYARKLSDSTISLIEGFYRTGMPAETILDTVGRLLSFNQDEGFVCLDIAAVNLENGEAEIIKIGSPTGFIIGRDKLRLLSGETLPLGMLETAHPMTAKTNLLEDDILVFLSDGVTSAFGSDTDLVSFLQTLSPLNPQGLTDCILSEAKRLYGGKAEDDMTAVAVRLYAQ